ncbi:MAG: arginine--tRNA ligase [Candidatus Westeberhardia cardiocondylae]|nr:arginine--tRNA ligase [Candidatus Westeberhardia cardiocondylae]
MNISYILSKKINKALFIVTKLSIDFELKVHPSKRDEYGDYQVDGIMKIAKNIGFSSLELAKRIVSVLDLKDISSNINVISPGFINIFLNPKWLSKNLIKILHSSRLGIAFSTENKNIVVDYSSPNIAKEMHVGHMRSTIIGDTFVRISEFLGYCVIRSNHVGDWGTQFGMLIAYLQDMKIDSNNISISELGIYYSIARKKYNSDLSFFNKAHNCVVKLQNGDNDCRVIWKNLICLSIMENQKIYDLLNITLNKINYMGESMYNYMLPDIVKDLKNKGLAFNDHGAVIVYLDNINKDKVKFTGVIIRKKDGSYLYSSTDIAAVKYRCEIFKANRIVYYVDFRQCQHLIKIWEISRRAGYISNGVLLEHHVFGMVLGKDGKPFKTRSGKIIKLVDLLNESIKRAKKLILKKNIQISKNLLEKLAKKIGIGAIKYYELSKNRTINYVFDWNKVLDFNGNTSLYIQYAYTRIFSLLEKYYKKYSFKYLILSKIKLETKHEIKLAIHLLKFEEVILLVYRRGFPNLLCSYLYDLSVLFSVFYENFPIIFAKTEELRTTRILLLILISKTLEIGLNLLGIEIVHKM